MGNHFHLLVKVKTSVDYTDIDVKRRVGFYYQDESRVVTEGNIWDRRIILDFQEDLSNVKIW